MAPTTQRLKYYTGEFLQSGDFTDEQSYHVAMRRLLNHELHLHGIVKGLQIVLDATSVPPVQFLSVAPGFAIDQVGREIYVSAPTSLTPLLSRPGLLAVQYELWIVYTETATGSPAPGYQLCNQLSQNTRWTESFDLMLRNPAVPPDPNTPDPNRDLKGICLGLVNVNYNGIVGFYFTLPPNDWYRRRTYAKIRAQSIIAPDDILDPNSYTFYGPAPSYTFPPPPEGYVYIKTPNGVYSDGDMLVQGNMLIGDDFVLDPTIDKGLPNTVPLPNPGNLKVAGDLFLQGKLFNNSAGPWLSLNDYIQSLIPDIQVINDVVIPSFGNPGLGTSTTSKSIGTATLALTSKLPNISGKQDVIASISSYTFVNQSALKTYIGVGNAAIKPSILVTVTQSITPPNIANFVVTCEVDGGNLSGVTYNFLIDSVVVDLLVVFHP